VENRVIAGLRFEIESATFYGYKFLVLNGQSFVTGEVLFGFHLADSDAFLLVLVNHHRLERIFLHETPSYLRLLYFSSLEVSAKGALGRQPLGYLACLGFAIKLAFNVQY
jgi:hypothetical protein